MKNIILIHNNFKNILKIAQVITEIGETLFISTKLKNGLQFLNFERAELFIIDGSYPLEVEDIIGLKDLKTEIILINRDYSESNVESIGKIVDENEFIESLKSFNKSRSSKTVSVKKDPHIFRDIETFKLSITQEVRRAKRYRYPFVVVMFELTDDSYAQHIINYFSSKIREFDSLWIYNSNKFSMILPHTGWNGAEILTNRLTTYITQELGIEIDSLKNVILSFKRIERDKAFIKRIEKSLDGDYYNINKSANFNIWKYELFSEFTEAKTIRMFNRYKGLLISHDSDIILNEQKLEVHNIREIQFSIIDSEKATYFYSKTLNKTIRAGVETVNGDKSSAILSNFEIISSDFIKNTGVKLLIEEDFPILISDKKAQISAKIVEISLDEVTIITENIAIFQNSSNLKLSFEIPFKALSYKIETEAKVLNIEEGTDISYIDLQIATSITDNMKISEYLSLKQIQFIKELRV